jgi:general secretion pathway protein G
MTPLRSRITPAFTLLEIMLVVMIIALLAGAAIHFMKDNVTIAGDVRVRGDLKTIGTQLMVYQSAAGFLPTNQQGLAALVVKPTSDPIPRNWKRTMSEVPTDPWGNQYVFETPARRSKEDYDLFSKGKDREANTEDDIGNW